MPVAPSHLPPSTLALLTSMLTAELGAATARRWAGDMLTTGVSSDALVELAMLYNHQWDRVRALVHQALRDAGIDTEPAGALPLLFFQLLLHAYLDGRIDVAIFCDRFVQAFNFKPGTAHIIENKRRILSDLFHVVVFYTPQEDGDYLSADADDVFKAAQTAATQLT